MLVELVGDSGSTIALPLQKSWRQADTKSLGHGRVRLCGAVIPRESEVIGQFSGGALRGSRLPGTGAALHPTWV